MLKGLSKVVGKFAERKKNSERDAAKKKRGRGGD